MKGEPHKVGVVDVSPATLDNNKGRRFLTAIADMA